MRPKRSTLAMILMILTVVIAESSLADNANKNLDADQADTVSESNPMILIDYGNSFGGQESYNESIKYYDRAIDILENRANLSQQQIPEIKKRLKEAVQEYEQLNQTFYQLEREYSPESMMFKGLDIAVESAILAEIPDLKIGLSKGTEDFLNDARRAGIFVGGLPRKVGVFQDTLNALKWNSVMRKEYIKNIQELLKEINIIYKEYKNAKGELKEISHISAMVWDRKGGSLYNLGRYTEALEAYDKAIEFNPESWQGKGETLKALQRQAEAKQAWNKAKELGTPASSTLLLHDPR